MHVSGRKSLAGIHTRPSVGVHRPRVFGIIMRGYDRSGAVLQEGLRSVPVGSDQLGTIHPHISSVKVDSSDRIEANEHVCNHLKKAGQKELNKEQKFGVNLTAGRHLTSESSSL